MRALSERNLTLAVAESSTGGLLGHLLTDIAGSSAVFVRGVTAYDDRLKERMGVPTEVLRTDGAVSEAAARLMAAGMRRWADADIGLGVTGIAGPGGATGTKPAGLTFVALADAASTICQRYVWDGNRSENKTASAEAALRLLVRRLESVEPA